MTKKQEIIFINNSYWRALSQQYPDENVLSRSAIIDVIGTKGLKRLVDCRKIILVVENDQEAEEKYKIRAARKLHSLL